MGLIMDRHAANKILNAIKDGRNMPLSVATAALEQTGDISPFSGQPLHLDGQESWNDRPCQVDGQTAGKEFSWSGYLDCQTN